MLSIFSCKSNGSQKRGHLGISVVNDENYSNEYAFISDAFQEPRLNKNALRKTQ